MKKYLISAGLGILILLGIGYAAKADPLVTQVFNPSVQLGEFCSGEIIYSKRDQKSGKVSSVVLTAKHCVDDKSYSDVIPVNKHQYDSKLRHIGIKEYDANVLGKSYKSDLALLKIRDEDTVFDDVAKVAKNPTLAFGQDVVVVGYPMGRSMTYTEGNLGFVEDTDFFSDVSNSGQFLRATPDIAPGSSGSSMFTFVDGEYKIIGVVTGGARSFSWFNYFTPVEEINEYLDVAKQTYFTEEDKKALEEEKKKENK